MNTKAICIHTKRIHSYNPKHGNNQFKVPFFETLLSSNAFLQPVFFKAAVEDPLENGKLPLAYSRTLAANFNLFHSLYLVCGSLLIGRCRDLYHTY